MLYILVTQLSSLANIYNKTNVLKHISFTIEILSLRYYFI